MLAPAVSRWLLASSVVAALLATPGHAAEMRPGRVARVETPRAVGSEVRRQLRAMLADGAPQAIAVPTTRSPAASPPPPASAGEPRRFTSYLYDALDRMHDSRVGRARRAPIVRP
jgi:hypothetical protein